MITIAIIFETRSEHIKASIPAGYDETDPDYEEAERTITITCIFFWFFGLVEFVIIFAGQTLFNSQINILMVFAHAASIASLLDFKRKIGNVESLSVTIVLAG